MKVFFLGFVSVCAAINTVYGQTSFFNLDNASISGGASNVNSKYTYVGADPEGRYDVVVTVQARSSNSSIFSNPQADAYTGLTAGDTFAYAAPYFTPSWNLNDGRTTGNFVASMTFSFAVFDTGTTNPVSLNLYATTFDNDGGENGNDSTVRERVIYGGSPTYVSVGSGQTKVGNQFTATTTTNAPGISTSSDYKVVALYEGASSFTWSASHLVNDLRPNGGDSSRLSALQLGFTIPEPHLPVLGLVSLTVLLLRRNRR